MPLYEFVCTECRHPFEELILGSERPACPSCGSARLEKRFSPFAVSGEARPAASPPGACGTCGDPRGPGACAMD